MRNDIIKLITGPTGKLHHFCLKKDWWIKKDAEDLYNQVFLLTEFLDETTSFRERLFYIENNWIELQKCFICKHSRRVFSKNTLSLSTICSNKSCKQVKQSITAIQANKNLPDHIKKQKAEKCRVANSGKFEERFGITKAQELKELQRNRMLGTKQSKELIEKRLGWRRGTSQSTETKKKISESNKKTHNSPEYRLTRIEQDIQTGKKLSVIMKEKIATGQFIPCVTNSWTRKNIELDIGGIKTKYRSSWEAAFAIINPTYQYEKIRIPYSIDGKERTYIVDFADFDNKVLYEIKPSAMISSMICKQKATAAIKWSSDNGWSYKFVSDDWFIINLHQLQQLKFPYLPTLKKGLPHGSKNT
jgi:hypothetical protein